MVAPRPLGPGLVSRRVEVATDRVAMLRFLLEAHEGLGLMHSEGDGWVTLMSPDSQEQALDNFIEDLAASGLVRLTRSSETGT